MQFIDIAKLVENIKIIKGKEVIIWGAGNMGRCITEVLPVNIKYYIDSDKNKNGGFIEDIPIYHYEKLYSEEIENKIIIIATTIDRAFIEMSKILTEMGLVENESFINGNIFYELYLVSKDKEYDKLFRKFYWESRVDDLAEHNKKYINELPMIEDIMKIHKPKKLLEIGIGSGRFLDIYYKYNVEEVVGQDIAEKGLKLCQSKHPKYCFINKEIYELRYKNNYFDICIINRVLSAIPKEEITKVLDKLCSISKVIMINEYAENEYSGDSSYWFLHKDLLKKVSDRGFLVTKKYDLDYGEYMNTNGKTYAYILEKI